jgi:homoserine dehydrogenase
MGEGNISLESVIQRPDLRASEPGVEEETSRTVVLITHETIESAVREALTRIANDGFIVGQPQLIRIEEF